MITNHTDPFYIPLVHCHSIYFGGNFQRRLSQVHWLGVCLINSSMAFVNVAVNVSISLLSSDVRSISMG